MKLWSGIDLAPLATLDVMATPSVAGLRQVRDLEHHYIGEIYATVTIVQKMINGNI